MGMRILAPLDSFPSELATDVEVDAKNNGFVSALVALENKSGKIGTIAEKIAYVMGDYTATELDNILLVNNDSNKTSIIITLPSELEIGTVLIIKSIGKGKFSVVPAPDCYLEGGASEVLAQSNRSSLSVLYSGNGHWYIISNY